MPVPPPGTCPRCSTPATGRFCAACGGPLDGATCGECRTALTPGAKFCHRCGTAAGAGAARSEPRGIAAALPWAVAGIALLALVALVAGQRWNATRDVAAATAATPATALDASATGIGVVRAPDISSMSPQERADRLYNRIMSLHEQGKTDSVRFLAPMALAAYQMLEPLDADQRYDLGRIGEAIGVSGLARAQADTILREQPTHLLGLILAASAAALAGDDAARREFQRRLLAAEQSELRRNLPEYQRHRTDIARALAQAR